MKHDKIKEQLRQELKQLTYEKKEYEKKLNDINNDVRRLQIIIDAFEGKLDIAPAEQKPRKKRRSWAKGIIEALESAKNPLSYEEIEKTFDDPEELSIKQALARHIKNNKISQTEDGKYKIVG